MVVERRVRVHRAFAIPSDLIPNDADWGDISNRELVARKLSLLNCINQNELPYSITVSICSLIFQIKSDTELHSELKTYTVDSSRFDYVIEWRDLKWFDISAREFEDESGQDTLYFSIEQIEYAIQRDFVAKISKTFISLISDMSIMDGLQNLWRTIIPRKLLSKNKFVIHCSGINLKHDKAILFMGPSGVGKSTIFKNFQKTSSLHDDMNIVSITHHSKALVNGAELGSILIHKNEKFEKQFKLVGIFLLEQSNCNQIVELSKAEQTGLIVANLANYFWPSLNQNLVLQLFNFANELVNLVPVMKLRNFPGSEVIALLEEKYGDR